MVLALAACGDGGSGLTGSVKIDGSSTVFPIAEAMGEEFQLLNRKVRLTVGISGTGGGFKKFCRGETDITNASRPIKAVEVYTCADNGVYFIELPIDIDGLSVLVNPKNDWVD
ncbi:MAG: substrate-binding domain-containing protein, partial [Dehalococcoidia bacterium]